MNYLTMKRNLLTVILLIISTLGVMEYAVGQTLPKASILRQVGCGTGANAGKAEVIVTVDQDNTSNYMYDFGNGYSSSNRAWLDPGTRTIAVRRNDNKQYSVTITIPGRTATPTITPIITYTCNTADVRLTNDQGTYNYTYVYNGQTQGNPYFRNLSVGQHTITVKYTPAPSAVNKTIVFYDDFGVKDANSPQKSVSSPYVNKGVYFDPLDGTGIQRRPIDNATRSNDLKVDSSYGIVTTADISFLNSAYWWYVCNDKDGNPNGRFLWYNANITDAENATFKKNVAYKRQATIQPGKPVQFSAYVYNPVKNTITNDQRVRVQLQIFRTEADAMNNTNPIYTNDNYSYHQWLPKNNTTGNDWMGMEVTANTLPSDTALWFVVRFDAPGASGNDIAIDNISVTQPADTCENSMDVAVNVASNTNTFSTTISYATCNATTGIITVNASDTTNYDYTYSLDGQAAQTNKVFNGVAVGVHTITIKATPKGAKTLFKEDFGSGAPYRLPTSVVPANFVCRDQMIAYPADILPEGHYQVANQSNLTPFMGWNWRNPKDHTDSSNPQGRYLAFNYGANANKVFYQQDIKVERNKLITVEFYIYNLNKSTGTSGYPKIDVRFEDLDIHNDIHSFSFVPTTGNVNDTDWRKCTFTFTSAVGDKLRMKFINLEGSEGSNDFAIDDILVTQAYEACTTTLTTTVTAQITRAFAGVTKLIGCGTGLNANKAEVQVTNVEGGAAPYEYQFGTGASWVASNTGWLDAGTHTVSVRNAGSIGCVYSMSVTVPAALAQPTIKTEVFYGCDGKAILQVGVQSPVNELTYLYKLDSGAFTTTNIFTDISTGTHEVSVKYSYREISSPYILMKEDFGKGDPTSNSWVDTNYFTFKDPRTTGIIQAEYTVAAYKDFIAPTAYAALRAPYWPGAPASYWRAPLKGTTTGGNDDRYLYADMSQATYNKIFLEKEVTIDPNSPIEFNFQLASCDGNGIYSGRELSHPNMQIKIVDAANPAIQIAAISSGSIPHDGQWHLISSRNLGTLNPNGASRIKIQFINLEQDDFGNDIAIDDITVWQTPATCGQVVSITQNITDNPVGVASFTAASLGCSATNGTVVVTASPTTGYIYTYTLQGGTATSVNTFKNLSFGTHTFTINYAPVTNTLVLLNEDFGEGTDVVKSPYVGKNLYFNENKLSAYTAYNGNGQSKAHPGSGLFDGEYTISHNFVNPYAGIWLTPNDHTGNTNGRIFIVNPPAGPSQTIYAREVNVLPNQALTFSAYFYNLLINPGADPKVRLTVYKSKTDYENSSTPLKSFISNEIPRNANDPNAWKQESVSLTATEVGARSSVYVVVSMVSPDSGGHDMAMDDIRITQSIGCEATVTATVLPGVTRAFAGVTKLIGCGTGLNANKAEVQVTNIEGGTAPYEYQFGTGASWVASNTGWLDAGTHTVSVRNAGSIGCVYSMSVNVPAALATPVIKTEVFYGCDGKPTLQVGVQSPVNELTYLYKLDSGAFTTTSVFANVSSGTHQVSVKYSYREISSPYILMKEDFGKGAPMALPGIVPSTWQHQPANGGTQALDCLHEGKYTVAPQSKVITCAGWCWTIPKDHTSNGADATGRYYAMNVGGATPGQVFYYKDVDNIKPNRPVKYEMYLANLLNTSCPAHPTSIDANIQIKIIDKNTSAVLDTQSTGHLPRAANDFAWQKYEGTLNPGNATSIRIQFIDLEAGYSGNDFAIDDITVYQDPDTCGQVVSITQNITDNPVGVASFTAAQLGCGATNGTVVVTASPTTGYVYTYTLQGGGTATSVNTFKNLSFGTHTFTINYAPVTNTLVLLNEDFGEGTDAVKSPYVGKNLYFNENTLSAYTAYNANKQSINHLANTPLMEGEYTIASNMVKLSYDWIVPTDRSGKANGRKLFIDGNISVPEQEVYAREVSIAPNLPLTFTTDFYNLVHNTAVPSANNPRVNIALYESEASYKNGSGLLAQSTIEELLSVGNQWKTHTLTLTAGDVGARTRIYAVVKMHNVINMGHDLTIDNIRITQSIGCEATVTATVLPGVTRAFAGVTQLIGCGTEENADKAEVRVSNVEGGTAPYEYQFGTGAAWVTTNTMWLEAGTYTVSVRSNGGVGCVFSTKVVVPEKLGTPTVTTQVQYDCEGKGILTVGIENPDPALRYWFSLNGEAYTTTYIFTGLTSGTQYLSVKYDYITPPQSVLLFKDDFGNGVPTALPGPASDYSLTFGNFPNLPSGYYQVVSQADAPTYWAILTPFGSCAMGNPSGVDKRWVSVYDHTSRGTDGTGRFYMSDFRGNQTDGDLFYKREVSVLPGSDISYEFYAMNLFRGDSTESPFVLGRHALKPNVVVRLVAPNGTVVTSTTTGEMPYSVCATNVEANLNNWRKYEGKLNVGTYTKLTVEIRSVGSASHAWGNDMAMDDITVLMTPKSCGQYYNVDTDVIATDRVVPQFTVSRTIDCATGKGGFVVTPTLTTGYTYTYTLGSTTVTGTIATFTGLSFSDTTHTITVQYQSVSKTVTVLKEDFGAGVEAVKNAYVAKNLYFNKNVNATYSATNANGQVRNHLGDNLLDGEYTVSNNLIGTYGGWLVPNDHSGKPNGRMLFVNPENTTVQPVYEREVTILQGKPLNLSAYFYNLHTSIGAKPKVQMAVYESKAAYENNNPPLKKFPATYEVDHNNGDSNAWHHKELTLTNTEVGTRSSVFVVIQLENTNNNGNDFVIDDITVTQELPACVVTFTATLTNEGLRTPTLSVPANIDILCTSATATTAVANWIAQATATDTNCDVAATVTATYTYTGSLCNAGSVTVTFTATGTFGNITTKTAVINFIKTPLVVTPTVLQVPDNTTGGTTSSVIPNITLGGVTSPSVNSVTITFSGLPAGVTSTTGGRLVVAPNTPAGVHSISYRVCEVANSNNCKTVTSTLIIGAATPTVGANTFTATTNTRTVIPGVIGNILTGATVGTRTATAGVGGNVSITLTHTPTTPNAPQIDPATGSVTVSSNTPAGVYTIGYQLCSSPIHCQAAVATITVPQIKPYIPAATITHSGTATTTRSIFVGGHVNGGTQSPTVGTGGSVSIGNIVNPTPATPGASVPYLTPTTGVITVPPTTPNGVYTISYQVCTTATPTSCVTGTTTITVANVTPTVTADSFTANTNTRTTVPGVIGNVLTNDRVGSRSATAGTGGNVTINITHTPTTPNAPVLHPATGSVTVSGNTPAGVYTISYEVCNGSACTPTNVVVTVPQLQPNVPNVTITHSGTATTTRNVLDGATVNGGSQSATVTGANPTVQITVTSTPIGSVVPRLDPSTGIVRVPPATPDGVYTISYSVCTTATPTSCVSRTTTIIVGNVTPTVTPDDVTASVTTNSVVPGTIGNILTNDTIGGASVTTNEVTIRVTHTPTTPNAPVLHPATGSVTVSGNTPAGVYTISYEVCNGAKCATGTVTVTVPQLLPNVPNVSITHSGTATTTRNVLDGGTVNGGSQSATVTGANPTVQITVTSSPTGSVVPRLDPSTGIVTVPPTTPNGVYTISYSVCTTATPTSCISRTTVITVGNSSATTTTPTVTPDDVTASVTTNSVVPGTIGNILTNDRVGTGSATAGTGGNVTIRVTHTPTTPNAPVLNPATGSVTVSGNTPAGVYTIGYEVCNGAKCATGTVTVTVPQLQPNVPNVTITHSGTATTTRNVLDGGTVNGGSQSATVTGANPTVQITVTSTPTGSVVPRLDPSTGIVTVPPTTPNGVYTISYSICTTATPTSCVSRTTTIVVGNVTPTVTPDDVTASVTTNSVVSGTIGNILTNDHVGTGSATAGTGGNVIIRVTHTPTTPNAPVLHPATGSVTVSGNTPAGVYTIGYEVCNGANCATGTVTVTVPQLLPNVPNTTITHNGTTTTTGNVLAGGTVNGGSQSATVTGANPTVQITVTSTPTGSVVPRLDPSTGIVTVPPTTPNGVYTISYSICTTATPTSCVSRTTTIIVGNVTPTVTPDDVTASVTTSGVVSGTIGNILTNDNIGGASATTNLVTISVTHTPTTPNAPVLNPATGSVTVSSNTPAGVYTIGYEVCNGAKCATGTVTVTVPQLLPNVPTVSITHSGTATTTRNVLDGATVNGGSQSATVTGANPTVQITVTSSPTGSVVPRLDPSTGIVTVPPTTPNGVYTISYNICTTATPTSCVSRTTVITVGNSSATTTTPTIVITPDSFVVSSTSTRTTPSVFDNDRIVDANGNTHSVTSSTVTISTQTVTTNASGNTVTPTINPDGTITIPEGLRPGNYTITYQLCTTTTPTTCANGTVTFTVVPTQPTVIVNPDSFVVTGTGTRTTPSVFDNDHILHPNGSTTAVNSSTVTISTQSVTTNASGNTVTPTINPDGTITIPEGLRPGNYTITYQLCTTASPSTCTTGEVNFDVPDNEVPDAHTITATTFINTPVEIKVTDKPATHVNVITPPANGIATNNGDGTITYEPNNGFVGTDEFEYTLCTAGGCSTATVRITVTADLIIYNGVSLNGSALNNHFHIGGIEAYPNNTVRIYNRWGAEVFSAEGYDNLTKVFNGRSNARATMDAGDHLPQGTYYYIIEYYDAANERHKEVGWLYLKK